MDFQQLLDSVTPDIYENLKRAVELGKWPDGAQLSNEQRENCLQVMIAYETKHLSPEERTGYIHQESHTHCGGTGEVTGVDEDQLVKWTS